MEENWRTQLQTKSHLIKTFHELTTMGIVKKTNDRKWQKLICPILILSLSPFGLLREPSFFAARKVKEKTIIK
ncbi:unnamed protein product [Dovyalis caffra]|uniref:Uncharacterized protein n=1 Tax=Dovyalis caffra TaxID=77055 RepID=A0AAV1SS31_9ROSI|nr:unnamed protein product [Dovyalis caffra]